LFTHKSVPVIFEPPFTYVHTHTHTHIYIYICTYITSCLHTHRRTRAHSLQQAYTLHACLYKSHMKGTGCLLQYRSMETPDTRKESVNTAHSACGARFAFIGTLVATLSQINIPIVNTRTSLPL